MVKVCDKLGASNMRVLAFFRLTPPPVPLFFKVNISFKSTFCPPLMNNSHQGIKVYSRNARTPSSEKRRAGEELAAIRTKAPFLHSIYNYLKMSCAQMITNKRSITAFVIILLNILVVFSAFATTRFYRLIWNDDPATTMTIGFDLSSGDLNSVRVLYDTQDHGGNTAAYAFSETPYRNVDYNNMQNVFVKLNNLQANTIYYFLVIDNEGSSERMFFQTAPDSPNTRLSLVAGGDSRDLPDILTGGVDDEIGRQNANKMVAKLRPHGVVFGGDMTWANDDVPIYSDVEPEWEEWFQDWQLTKAPDGRMTPIIVARGNHESSNETIYNFFDTPSPEIYYALNFGNGLLRLYTLNSEISLLGNQLNWLNNDLTSNCATWKMVQYHKPMRPHHGEKPEQNDMAVYWAPLFEDNGVQLVVECDVHLSKYTYPIRTARNFPRHDEGFIRDDEQGVVYIGEGGWGAELRAADDKKGWTMASESFNQVKWIFVDAQSIEVRTVKTDNADAVVGKTATDDLFAVPANMEIWTPTVTRPATGTTSYSNGVLILNNPNSCN